MIGQEASKHTAWGYLYVLAATAIWSGNFIVARGLAGSMPPVHLSFYRWLVAVAVVLPFAVRALRAEWHVMRKHKIYLAFISLLGISLFNTLIYYAGQTTTAINLSLISITAPMFMIGLSSVFLRERIVLQTLMGLAIVVVGILVLITRGHIENLFHLSFVAGDALMLLAALSFSVYSILLRRKPFAGSMVAFQWCTFFLGELFLTPVYVWDIVYGGGYKPLSLNAIGGILYIGIFASFVSFTLWNKALQTIGATKTAMMYYTLPVFSAISASFLLGETIGIVHGVSVGLIFGGIVLANYVRKE